LKKFFQKPGTICRYQQSLLKKTVTQVLCFEEGLRVKEGLTCREKEILILRAAGYARKDIAEELGVALSTVKTHLVNIHRKLEVDTQAALINKALKMGIQPAAEK